MSFAHARSGHQWATCTESMNLDEVVIHRKERDRIGARDDDRDPTVQLETSEIHGLVA